MKNAIIACRQKELSRAVAEILREMDFSLIDNVLSGAETRRRIQDTEYDLLIVNTPLSDEVGVDLVLDVSENYDMGIIVLVKSEAVASFEDQLEGSAAFVVPKPLSKASLKQNIHFLSTSRQKMAALVRQNDKLKRKMDEMKVIYRGKLYLMGHLDMTEDQAHRYIQKKAMDLRLRPAEVAERIIDTFSHRRD